MKYYWEEAHEGIYYYCPKEDYKNHTLSATVMKDSFFTHYNATIHLDNLTLKMSTGFDSVADAKSWVERNIDTALQDYFKDEVLKLVEMEKFYCNK